MTNPTMVGRILPPEEWADKLAGTPLAERLADLNPDYTVIIVVEVDGQVVAEWAAINVVHVEGLWEAPDHRGGPGVSRQLLQTMLTELTRHHVGEVITRAETPAVEALIQKAGGIPLPGTAWVLTIPKE